VEYLFGTSLLSHLNYDPLKSTTSLLTQLSSTTPHHQHQQEEQGILLHDEAWLYPMERGTSFANQLKVNNTYYLLYYLLNSRTIRWSVMFMIP
jgi:hypothetical protein